MSFPDEQAPPGNGAPVQGSPEPRKEATAAQGDELTQVREQLGAAQAQAQENRGQYLRALAEMENVRKRAARDVEQAHKFAIERFAGDLIEVKDSLEMGLAAAEAADAQALRAGVQATLQLLTKAFERAGLKEVVPEGQPFDPQLHEAMAAQPARDRPANTVLTVVQKGYVLNGRLLRPARVIVARAE